MEIFAPLAGRMGMQWMREELEDLSFKVLNSEARNSIIRRFLMLQREAGDVVHQISGDIRTELDKAASGGRRLWPRQETLFDLAQDAGKGSGVFQPVRHLRLSHHLPHSVADCYGILGVIHQRWRAVPGRFKDYISQPKTNGYRSIHTTVSGRDGKRVEVQIRTQEMHEVAEAGVAAHWAYREGRAHVEPLCRRPGEMGQPTDRTL